MNRPDLEKTGPETDGHSTWEPSSGGDENHDDNLGPRYPYLKGIPLYNAIAALIVGMLLLGLDINVVSTVSSQ